MRVLLTGQMRSGTTFLANILNAQPDMRILADFLHIERLQKQIGNPPMNEPLTPRQKESLIDRFSGGGDGWKEIQTATGAQMPCQVGPTDFGTLKDFYLHILDQIQQGKYTVVGHKTTCAEDAIGELLRCVPDLYCIYMYRDPRDVVVSNGNEMGQDPLTVLDNWKQSWEIAAEVKAEGTLGQRLFLLRYEDLIQNKAVILQELGRFLGRKALIVPEEVQWHGKTFVANSSFTDVNRLFDKTPIGRWRTQWPWVGMLAQVYIGKQLLQAGYKSSFLMKCKCHFIKTSNSLIGQLWGLPTYAALKNRRIRPRSAFPEFTDIPPLPKGKLNGVTARVMSEVASEKSRRAVVTIWAPTHAKELQRLVTFLQRETNWQPVVMLGNTECASAETKAEWRRVGVPWFIFDQDSSKSSTKNNSLTSQLRSASQLFRRLIQFVAFLPVYFSLSSLRTAKQLARRALPPQVWNALSRVRARLRKSELRMFVHQNMEFLRKVSEFYALYRVAHKVFTYIKPDVLVLAEDNVSYLTGFLIKASLKCGAASVVIPYTLANPREFIEGFRNEQEYSTRRFYNRLIAVLFPKWCLYEQNEGILRLPGHQILAMELLRAAPDRPWVPNSGRWDAFAVESPRMYDRYVKEFAMPASRMTITGAMSDDALYRATQSAAELKMGVYRELGLAPDRPMVLLAFPPNQFSRRHPDLEFKDYQSMAQYLIETLGTLGDYNVVVSLHPRVANEQQQFIKAMGAKICMRDTLELVPICDLYIASASATIRWAIACNIPVINYDLYQYRYDDYLDAPGVRSLQTKAQWLAALQELETISKGADGLSVNHQRGGAVWGVVDGRSGWRIVKLFDTLAKRSLDAEGGGIIQQGDLDSIPLRRAA